ncbi:hypothetical protein D9758_015960 [Tetrapyrgos nigripes]|uniref:Uncharacterized protein n=1 Tax=Tetrapyrgos nigripes TaxID=182062 RepID=A0A8H5FDM0_9AGAR|nr:hypothetical protein D9758_015960 [Tetrapyrgos nigripes]
MIHIFCWLLVILLLEARGLVSFQLSLLVMGLYLLAIYHILRGAASPAPVKVKKYICITDSNKLSTTDVESPEAVDVPLLDSSADQPPAQISEQQVDECVLSIQSTGSSTESKVPHVRFTEEPDEDTSSEAESTSTSSKRSRHVDFASRDDVRFFFSSDPPPS